MKEIINLTDENFEKAISQGTSIIDFWAPWCGPCIMQTPILEKLVQNNTQDFNVFKVNVDENQEVAMKYGIQSIPTIMIFKNGDVSNILIGVQDEDRLLKAIV